MEPLKFDPPVCISVITAKTVRTLKEELKWHEKFPQIYDFRVKMMVKYFSEEATKLAEVHITRKIQPERTD